MDPNFAPQDDVSQDPTSPDMPEDNIAEHFEEWRNKYFKESIKGNANLLIDMLNKVRDRDLQASQRKFVEDNLQIQFLRQVSNVSQASKEIRKAVNDDLDTNNPGSTIVNHIDESLQKQRMLVDVFIKMTGYLGMKGDLHRKYIAALLGAVQVGSGASNEDIILNDNSYSVNISTRIAKEFGMFDLGSWSLRANDPDRFLSDSELKRMTNGSPAEREVMRYRVIIDSICERFMKRAFIMTVVADDGTVQNIGWDLGTCLKQAYTHGKLVIKTKESDGSEIMFTPDGDAVAIMDLDIAYVKDMGETDEDGKKKSHHAPFIERRDGMLFLVASVDVLKEASTMMQGLVIKDIPYQGNPSDLKVLTRCTASTSELLMRQC
jgi:hypothetical protein